MTAEHLNFNGTVASYLGRFQGKKFFFREPKNILADNFSCLLWRASGIYAGTD